MTPQSSPIRTIIVQPTLAGYRVPVYRELAAREGVDLRLWYGDHGTLKNAAPDGFAAEPRRLRTWKLAGQEVLWHQAQLDAVSDDRSDVVVLSWGTRYLSLGPALRRAKRLAKPVLLWGHGYSKIDSLLRRWARDRIARYATALMFYDQRTADAAVDSGWPSDRVFVAPNAIDQSPIAEARDQYLAEPSRLQAFRSEQGIENRRVLLFVSRFSPDKRVELLVEAMDHLKRQTPEALAVLVGGGQEHDRIASLVKDKGLSEHVRLLGPIYEEASLAPWFLAADAFVYPTAIGLSLLHAFGYGLPVVTDDASAGHNPEIIAFDPHEGPSQNGLTYRCGDTADLAAVIERLLRDDPLRERLATNAQATVRSRYNLSAMVDGMESAIRRCHEAGHDAGG